MNVHSIEDLRKIAEKAVSEQWSKNMNEEYGPFDTSPEAKVRAYTPEDMFDPEVIEGEVQRRKESGDEFVSLVSPRDLSNRAPLTTDLVQFVLFLRQDTDFFSGPDLDQHHPQADEPDFYEILAQNALIYTGE